ncbi:Serine/threonine-protein kinase/endoribonuclease IRE1 [Armadillidium nasatum]|uniref:Serine/threonine-protein kinase/endoribonuclease IRE1 n=1 Tax=Armadillidium nasatum TaxID=96803 RepID=A0A5N5TEE3_9CRUS|nr:Serine/threonine-protein kinase/endoribonuclease IRE1 [Armadillidium nasatum]
MKRIISLIILAFIAFGIFCEAKLATKESVKEKISITGLLADGDDELLLVSTLDGALHAVTKTTGIKRWTLKDEPVIQNPSNSDDPPIPKFFPNPQDGSLYRYTAGRGREPLKKLPFTIPELVANSPCRSTDGIFYIGKKVDTWVGVDSVTGKTQLVMGADSVEKVCPKQSQNTIYLGRTLYNVVLFELNTGHKWNVSFYHYTSTSTTTEHKNYDLIHYTATGEGSILTVDQKTGIPIWNMEFESPVVAMYIIDTASSLTSVPLTTVTSHTLQRLSCNLKEFSHVEGVESSGDLLIKELSPTIFLGESPSGVYALPAFVDTSTARISRRQSQLLLDGPPGQRATIGRSDEPPVEDDQEGSDVLLLGYYDIPESLKTELKKTSDSEIAFLPLGITHQRNSSTFLPTDHEFKKEGNSVHQHVFWYGIRQFTRVNTTFIFSSDSFVWVSSISRLSIAWLTSDPLNFMVAALIAGFCVIIVLLYQQAQGYARLNREMSSRRVNSSRGSSGTVSGDEITAVAEELEMGIIQSWEK